MSEFEFWGIIFFKVMAFKLVFEMSMTLINGWFSAQSKMKFAEGFKQAIENGSIKLDE